MFLLNSAIKICFMRYEILTKYYIIALYLYLIKPDEEVAVLVELNDLAFFLSA